MENELFYVIHGPESMLTSTSIFSQDPLQKCPETITIAAKTSSTDTPTLTAVAETSPSSLTSQHPPLQISEQDAVFQNIFVALNVAAASLGPFFRKSTDFFFYEHAEDLQNKFLYGPQDTIQGNVIDKAEGILDTAILGKDGWVEGWLD